MKRWAKYEVDILSQYYPNYGVVYCSKFIKRNPSSISKKANRMGLFTRITSYGLPQKRVVEQLVDSKVISSCKIHNLTSHYTSCGKISGCVKCMKILNSKKIRTDSMRKYDREKSKRYSSTPIGRYKGRLRRLLSHCFKNKNVYKSKGCFRHLPYSPQQLCDHLENIRVCQNNKCPTCLISYDITGTNIDHIIPLAIAKTNAEILELFDINNLSLLCPKCNREKGAKIEVKICVH